MRILYLAGADLSLPQGQAVHIRRLTEALERRGHVVRLIAHRPRNPFGWEGPSGGLVLVSRPPIPRLGHLLVELALSRQARWDLLRFDPDIWLVRAELYGFAALLAPRGRAALVVETNAALPAILRASGASAWRCGLARRLERALLRRAAAIGTVTESLARIQVRSHRLEPKRVLVIPNGALIPPPLENGLPSLRRSREVADDEFLLGFAGNLNHVQSLGIVLEGLERLAPARVRLWVIGEGERKQALQNQCRRLGLGNRVQFLGGMGEEEAARHALACQVLLAPYVKEAYEALGGEADAIKVLQALACDRPVLASRVRGLEFLETLRSPLAAEATGAGELIEAGDPTAWTEAIDRWANRWIRDGRGLRDWPWPEGQGPGRHYIQAGRTWDHCAQAWEAVFKVARGALDG